jgi:REP-associated tyrosine transposase
MYIWRKLTVEQREELLKHRIGLVQPWHSPPTVFHEGRFHLTAACYFHRPFIGVSLERLEQFSTKLLATLTENGFQVFAWCVLPNHYHVLTETTKLRILKQKIGQLHGRMSREWNIEEHTTGRSVWHGCSDRAIRTERHFWVTVNYIHQNPVRHGYVKRWSEWPFSSASSFLSSVGRERAIEIWRNYPLKDYGARWDDPAL